MAESVREWVAAAIDDLQRLGGWPDNPMIEHTIESDRNQHGAWLTVSPLTTAPRFVVLHPPACGCDALPFETLLHG